MEKSEQIELVSLAHFRGRTFDNAIVIVDEFQNLSRSQLAMCIGRLRLTFDVALDMELLLLLLSEV